MANILGTAGNNTLLGDRDPLLPNDVINSGWLAGDDLMIGVNGDDTYNVNSMGDVVFEDDAPSSGVDTVVSQVVSYTLTDNVENLVLQEQDRSGTLNANGTVTLAFSLGAPAALNGTGNDLANTITGNSNGNILWGLAGADTISGGEGIDIVAGGTEGDTLNGDAGDDWLYGEDGADTLTGGADNDHLYGGYANDSLNGGIGTDTLDGGTGSDTMNGGSGNDVYYVDRAGDSVVEAALLLGGGIDTVYASVNETLDPNVENLTLTGTAASGTGNGLGNLIVGNSSANTLAGAGGNDTLRGGLGNDTLLIGDAGNDELNGESGLDILTGGTGLDSFVFTSSGVANADTITDFDHADDTIVLGNALDAAMAGALNPGLVGLSFIGGNVAGNTLAANRYFEGVGFNGSGTAARGIYVDTVSGEIHYNPTNVAGDEVLLGRVDFAIAGTLDNTDFVLGG